MNNHHVSCVITDAVLTKGVDDPYVVGGATDYLYPTFKRNFGFASFLLHMTLPAIVFLVGGFCSIWTLTHLDEV